MLSHYDLLKRARLLYHRARYEWLGGHPPYAASLVLAREAKARFDWSEAETHFRAASIVRPDSLGPRLNLAQALMETGRLEEAAAALREAVRRAPGSVQARLQLAHCLSMTGKSKEAATEYAVANALKPRIVRKDLTELWASVRGTLSASTPPEWQAEKDVLMIVEGRGSSPSGLRTILSGLTDQTDPRWSAIVWVDADAMQHPVASFAVQDPRITLIQTPEDALEGLALLPKQVETVLVTARTRLEPSALHWLRSISQRTRADALYGDHDHHHQDVRASPRWFGPVLLGAPSPLDLASNPSAPAIAHFTKIDWRAHVACMAAGPDHEAVSTLLVDLLGKGAQVRHLPVLLGSIRIMPSSSPVKRAAAKTSKQRPPACRISVIIPTRDEAAILNACVVSLKALADRPDALEIVVLDNRSRLLETHDLLARLSEDPSFVVAPMDEPFNWSRLNNAGARRATGDILVFANNDIEMLSRGWDSALRQHLDDPAIGAVGARLLYPDGTLQHVGVVLGAVGGRPVHEGRGAAPDDKGPQDRWARTREVGAVTGAFLAARTDTFEAVLGFDEGLAVAYNDLDFCLRVRASGLSVVYAANIEATHHESKTRGLALTSEKIAWDDEEFEHLRGVWGKACMTDPYVHPAWAFTTEASFDAFRPVTDSDLWKALDGDSLRTPPTPIIGRKRKPRSRQA
ncbi:hypothetical protein BH10PSE1_BH10PSE1_10940 [soil metagenome]